MDVKILKPARIGLSPSVKGVLETTLPLIKITSYVQHLHMPRVTIINGDQICR